MSKNTPSSSNSTVPTVTATIVKAPSGDSSVGSQLTVSLRFPPPLGSKEKSADPTLLICVLDKSGSMGDYYASQVAPAIQYVRLGGGYCCAIVWRRSVVADICVVGVMQDVMWLGG